MELESLSNLRPAIGHRFAIPSFEKLTPNFKSTWTLTPPFVCHVFFILLLGLLVVFVAALAAPADFDVQPWCLVCVLCESLEIIDCILVVKPDSHHHAGFSTVRGIRFQGQQTTIVNTPEDTLTRHFICSFKNRQPQKGCRQFDLSSQQILH